MKVVIGTDHVGAQFADDLRAEFPEVEFVAAYTPEEQVPAVAGADAFFGWPTRETFLAASDLRWIHCPGMGIDKIAAVGEIVESDVPVTNAPGTHVIPMAEYTLGTMIALAHRFQESFTDQQAKVWDTQKYSGRIVELAGTTVGIHGLGAIGRAVARRAAAFGMTIYAVDPHPAEIPDVVAECWDPDRLDDLATRANWLVISSPIIPETRGVFDARRISLMPEGSYVIIVSRGAVVDERALADALRSGHLAGAAIDATEKEPLPSESPLWDLDNVIVTSHVSALSPQLYELRRQTFKANLRRFVNGDPLQNVCDKRAGI